MVLLILLGIVGLIALLALFASKKDRQTAFLLCFLGVNILGFPTIYFLGVGNFLGMDYQPNYWVGLYLGVLLVLMFTSMFFFLNAWTKESKEN